LYHIRFLILVTLGVDALWLLFWVPRYNEKEMAKWNYGLHMFVAFVSILEMGLKVIIFLMLFCVKSKNRSTSQREYLKERYANAGELGYAQN